MASDSPPSGDWRDTADGSRTADEHPDGAPGKALRDALGHLAELKEYLRYYIDAKVDSYKVTVRNLVIYAILGVIGGIAGVAVVVTAVVLLMYGIASGIGRFCAWAFGSEAWWWIGPAAVGLFVLGAIAAGVMIGMKRLSGMTHRKLVAKYEDRQRRQRRELRPRRRRPRRRPTCRRISCPTRNFSPNSRRRPAMRSRGPSPKCAPNSGRVSIRSIGPSNIPGSRSAPVPWRGLPPPLSFVPSKEQQALRKLAAIERALNREARRHRTESNGNGKDHDRDADKDGADRSSSIFGLISRELIKTIRPALVSLLSAGVTAAVARPSEEEMRAAGDEPDGEPEPSNG